MKLRIRHLALLCAVIILGCSPLLRGRGSRYTHLSRSADKYLSGVSLRGSSWSIMAVDLADGAILLARDQDRSLIPASNLKLLVTACALETLGPEYRIVTTVGYTGQVDPSGTLNGDLVVIGAGDPSLSSRFADSTDTFSAWADSLLRRGIHSIKGDLIGYAGLFKGDPLGSGWEWDDLADWFAAEFSPLTYADDCVEITVAPADSVGKPALISWSPPGDFAQISGTISTAEAGGAAAISYNRELASNRITLWGAIPLGSEAQRRWVTVHHPADFFLEAMEQKLRQKGIAFTGTTRVSSSWQPDYADFKLLFVDLSPPLVNLIRVVNQQSHNLYAELLVRVLGVKAQAADLWGLRAQEDAFAAGCGRIREWESKLVGGSTGFVMADGSGLSRRNLACASELIKVLVNMNRSPNRWEFINSLATPGMGMLQGRFAGLPQGISLRVKTGSLTRVKALSGYLSLSGQPRIAFSFICNNYLCPAEEIDQTMESLCQILALYLKEQ